MVLQAHIKRCFQVLKEIFIELIFLQGMTHLMHILINNVSSYKNILKKGLNTFNEFCFTIKLHSNLSLFTTFPITVTSFRKEIRAAGKKNKNNLLNWLHKEMIFSF